MTTGNLKNLVTDKPAPITVALSQNGKKICKRGDQEVDCTLYGENVTKGALKNIVTDKPAPITKPVQAVAQRKGDNNATAAAQKHDNNSTQALHQGVPVHVNPVVMQDTVGTETLGIHMKVGQDDVNLHKKKDNNSTQSLSQGVPVHVNPVVLRDTEGEANLGLHILVGPDEVNLHKKD